jgi:hypothetical protein
VASIGNKAVCDAPANCISVRFRLSCLRVAAAAELPNTMPAANILMKELRMAKSVREIMGVVAQGA